MFLGAGASKELGIKTMQELTKDVVTSLEKRGYAQQTKQIISCLENVGIIPDFEAIYSVLEGLADIQQGIKNGGPFTAYICKPLDKIGIIPDAKDILSELKALIYEECSKVDRSKLNQVFDPLFQPDLSSPHKEIWLGVTSRIATTNYDMAVELYHWGRELPLTDGFDPTPNPHLRVLRPKNIPIVSDPDFGRRRGGKALIKLHGAIWYFKQGSRIVQTTNDPKDLPIDIQIAEQIMIYPTKEKPILRKPYYDFFRAFKDQVWNALIVIGYSFRDEPVNTILFEQLARTKNAQIFIIDPNANKVAENFPDFRKYKEHFHNVTIEFGKQGYEKELFQAIVPHLSRNSL